MNALNAYNKLNTNVAGLKKSSEKLSSGYRINRAGDDAAGLAISEKMRSQIRGLNQAKRNSQDGISMIQTFEGATQESHSILQRMKELASESANGTYQDEVDRDAIQLEYNQLNDELDQIADTDFNGVVMLNGGEMADGTKAVGGKFNYVAGDPRTEAMQLGSDDINTIDSKGYNANTTAAKNLWTDLGLTSDTESVELTLTYDAAKDTWSITDADNATALANKGNVTVDKGNAAKNNGGFSLKTKTGTLEVANVVIDTSKLVNGDTVKVKFTNPVNKNSAPENIGIKDGTLKTTVSTGSTAKSAAPTLEVNSAADADDKFVSTNGAGKKEMTAAAAKAFNGLNGATIESNQTLTGAGAADGGKTTYKLTLADGKTVSIDGTTTKTNSVVSDDGIKYTIATTDGTSMTISDADGNELAKIALGTITGGAKDDTVKNTFEIALDTATYSAATEPKVSIAEPAVDKSVSKADSNNAATAPLTYSDHLVLQTGSRTKDSVDFTFKYSTDGMGELKSNLDISSRANGLGTKDLSLATQESANAAIDKIDNAINKVSMVRATFGATQNRLEHKIENLTTNTENLTEAESSIRDTDMASEMLNYTKYNVLQQAAQSMLAQANQQPQSILQLLG